MKLYFIHIFCNKMNYEHILFKMKKFELFRHDDDFKIRTGYCQFTF